MKKLALSLMVLGVFGITDACAATKITKSKNVMTASAQAVAPAPAPAGAQARAPAKDPMCKVLLPDPLLTSQRDQYRCFR
jgi:hypothetical protein